MKQRPWDCWVPGVLSARQVRELRDQGFIVGLGEDIDPSSFDLALSGEVYEMPEGGVKPSGSNFLIDLKEQGLIRPLNGAPDRTFVLRTGKTYLFKLRERLSKRDELSSAGFHGQATAKSSIGRLDVLVRFVLDGMKSYEGFEPKALKDGSGEMYVEVTPLTFDILVREGVSLSQLRLFYGKPQNVGVRGKAVCRTLLRSDLPVVDGIISVDLHPYKIGGVDAIAFFPRPCKEPIDLCSSAGSVDPCKYWRIFKADGKDRLIISKSQFYILRSKERMWVPSGVAVYGRAIDETIGEMRIHYAGFVHPYFGTERADRQTGTPLIFEVRGHDVDVVLKHGEKMARLIFYRMSEDAEREAPERQAYTNQDLTLSKYFADWPTVLRHESDGSVAPEPGVTSEPSPVPEARL